MPSAAGLPQRAASACAGVVTLALLGGCSAIGPLRHEAPPRAVAPTVEAPPPRTGSGVWVVQQRPGQVESRVATVAAPADFTRSTIEFTDAKHGAALYTHCVGAGSTPSHPPSCEARLVVTADGGRSWQQRRHPQPRGANQQLYGGPDGVLLLLSEPHGWYLSKDAGRTFTAHPNSGSIPAFYHALFGRYQLDEAGGILQWTGEASKPVPVRPPLPGELAAVALRADRELWAASIDRGRAYAAVSTDHGATWQLSDIPGAEGGLMSLELQVSADGADVWLLGARQDRTRFPALWRLDPGGWRQLLAEGRPDSFTAAAPVGAGLLAVTGSAGTGLAGERYTPTDWPSGGWLRMLADGSLQANDDRDGTVWLGVGAGVSRHWAQLTMRQE